MASRDERRAEREAAARRWAQWLSENLERSQITPDDLTKAAAGQFDRSNVSHWLAGGSAPSPEDALLVGRLLGSDSVEALRAGGYQGIADVLAASRAQPGDLEELDRRIEERVAAQMPTAVPTPQDPIFAMIFAADLGESDEQELLTMRTADLDRLERTARDAEDAMRAIVEQRVVRAAAGPTPAQVRAAKAEISDAASMKVWDEFLDRHYARARESGSFDLMDRFLADTWSSVLAYRKVQREGAPSREQRVSGEEFVAAWESAHPGQKLAA